MITARLAIAIFMCMAIGSLLVGCGNDDSGPTGPALDLGLVGDWKVTEWTTEIDGEAETLTESQLDSLGIVWTLSMEDDGTAEQITNLSGPMITMPGTWETSSNQLTLELIGPSDDPTTMVYDYNLDGDILALEWTIGVSTENHAEFTKQ